MPNPNSNTQVPSRWLVISAFTAVYIIWGSTYLGIKYALETIPPFLMSGMRFLIAGIILYLWSYFKNEPIPQTIHWKNSVIIGALLLLCGNGMLVWAEQYIDSGMAALLITLEPIWIVLLLWVSSKKDPSFIILSGVIIGIAGMAILIDPTALSGAKGIDLRGVIGVSFSTLAWAIGSLYSVKAKLPSSSIQSTGMQMVAGGLMLIIAGTATGEWSEIDFNALSTKSLLAFTYLLVFGSLIGYTSYSFLLKNAHPNHVSTYAYVNPVIAVFLGWAFANEIINMQTLIASVLLIGAVVIIISYSPKKNI